MSLNKHKAFFEIGKSPTKQNAHDETVSFFKGTMVWYNYVFTQSIRHGELQLYPSTAQRTRLRCPS